MSASPLEQARNHLWRALEAERSMMRGHYLREAAAAFDAAGVPGWARLAEAAAHRIGGDDADMRELLFAVALECRGEHSLPVAAQ